MSLSSSQTNKKLLESEQHTNIINSTCNGAQNEEVPGIVDASPENCSKNVSDSKAKVLTKENSDQNSAAQTSGRKRGRPRIRPKTPAIVDAQETGGNRTRRRRKSAP